MSQKASGFERQNLEKYYTPAWVTEALLSKESFPQYPIDPAAGAGHMVDVLNAHGLEAIGMDLEPDSPNVGGPADFLSASGTAACIITNPPYGGAGATAVKFIKHALVMTQMRQGKVAMLLRVDFDSAKRRRVIFADHLAFKAKYVLTQRIRWANLPQSKAGPTENHAWFVWDWARDDRPVELGYLP